MNMFSLNLKQPGIGEKTFDFCEDDEFFNNFDSEIHAGCVDTQVRVSLVSGLYEIHIKSVGEVEVDCDRCLSALKLRIETDDVVYAKFGQPIDDDSDIIYLEEDNPEIDLADVIYQFIVLGIPIKHVHEPGMCDNAMMEILNQHQAVRSDLEDIWDSETDDDETSAGKEGNTDPRWDALKSLLGNDDK